MECGGPFATTNGMVLMLLWSVSSWASMEEQEPSVPCAMDKVDIMLGFESLKQSRSSILA